MALLEKTVTTLPEYLASGGGRGLEVALGASPEAVIEEVAKSGLRGRGGGGFPTGEKWRSIRTTGTGTRFAVCNGAEGEPATFKDRSLLRTNPYQVLEGLAIAAYAVGAERCYIGIKEAFAEEVRTVGRALEEMRSADALGGTTIDVVLGPDLYLFGEETGLEEVIERRPPLPRIARPFMLGLFATPPKDNPTLVNNVETLANVPRILADGPDWLRANGTETSPGTMVFTVCGDVRREGVFELPLGTPLRSLMEDQAGGPREGGSIKAIFPGASNTVILPEQLDTPMDFDSMRETGSSLGAGGFAVFDDTACMVRAAYLYSRFLWVESCAQCPACKFGTGEVTRALDEIELRGRAPDLELILMRARSSTDGQKCALPTGESLLIQSLVQVFADEFHAHVGTSCPLPRDLPFHKIVDWDPTTNRFRYDLTYAAKQPDWTFAS
ncbi:MAG: NADH-ubiquinone oxidoreductase-F iron-sulfur binding region domain-containing protein [Actinomycetota bacterium]